MSVWRCRLLGHVLSGHGDDGCHAMDGNFAPCYCVPREES